MGRFKRPIRRLKNGRYAFEIDDDLKRFIADLASQLHGVLGDDAPMLRRLFPTAYPDDPERDGTGHEPTPQLVHEARSVA